MADTSQTNNSGEGAIPIEQSVTEISVNKPQKPRGPSKFEQLNKIYALPAPLRTFPLPTLLPHNPLSLFHILYVWLSHTVNPPSSHFDPLYQGWFSPDTRSVHVTDLRSIRGLWEQGFFGKGSLSRSEPSWLKREETRRGNKKKMTSEEVTRKRRAERQQKKWERARKEREAIDLKLLEEAEAVLSKATELDGGPKMVPVVLVREIPQEMSKEDLKPSPLWTTDWAPPIGPLELLLLPNSNIDMKSSGNDVSKSLKRSCSAQDFDETFVEHFYKPPVGPLELLVLPNSVDSYPVSVRDASVDQSLLAATDMKASLDSRTNAFVDVKEVSEGLGIDGAAKVDECETVGGSDTNDEAIEGSVHSEETVTTSVTPPNGIAIAGAAFSPKIKRTKSVRFSPTVEKNTFLQSEPPSPEHAAGAPKVVVEEQLEPIQDQEHIQLTLEEAFFLSYTLGALTIFDPETKSLIENQDLFTRFRKASFFPPQDNPSMIPDDPFMINYVVYHHFRSLGWVPRSGIKFSVDFMLYIRGPVFTHAEFAVIILPSYSDPYWSSNASIKRHVKAKEERTWAWMSCINRVITQVKKTLILTYVDIPKPVAEDEEANLGIDAVLARYKIREVVMKRWAANRMRD